MIGVNQSIEHVYEPSTTSTVIDNLQPSIAYTISLTLVTHGGATITSKPISVSTKDGGKIYVVYNFAIYKKIRFIVYMQLLSSLCCTLFCIEKPACLVLTHLFMYHSETSGK